MNFAVIESGDLAVLLAGFIDLEEPAFHTAPHQDFAVLLQQAAQ